MVTKKICLITNEKHLLIQELQQHLEKAGVGVDVLSLKELQANILSGVVTSSLDAYRTVYLDRIEESWPSFGFQFLFLDSLLKSGATITNKPMSYMRSHDKVATTLELARHGLPTAGTIVCYDVPSAVAASKRWPVAISKPPLGYNGIGITVFETDRVPESVLAEQLHAQGVLYVQEYIRCTRARDVRIQLVDGEPVAAFERVAQASEKYPLCNIDQGAVANFVKVPDKAIDLAINAARVFDLDVVGVDLLVDDSDNYFISELNPESSTASWMPEFGEALAMLLLRKQG
jgi:RimK family alpha-L-glutamate ligase